MPKENIMDEQYGRYARLADSEGVPKEGTENVALISDAFVSVKWGRDSAHVQVACCNDEDPDGIKAQHVSLDRAGINRAIRTLRKARDAAFGSDA